MNSVVLTTVLLGLTSFKVLECSVCVFGPLKSVCVSEMCSRFLPVVCVLSVLSVVCYAFVPLHTLFSFGGVVTCSSVVRVGFSVFKFFDGSLVNLRNSAFLVFARTFVSDTLFLLVKVLCGECRDECLGCFRKLVCAVPLFSFFFLFFSFTGVSLPFYSSFLSRFFVLLSSLRFGPFLYLLLLFSLVLSSTFIV